MSEFTVKRIERMSNFTEYTVQGDETWQPWQAIARVIDDRTPDYDPDGESRGMRDVTISIGYQGGMAVDDAMRLIEALNKAVEIARQCEAERAAEALEAVGGITVAAAFESDPNPDSLWLGIKTNSYQIKRIDREPDGSYRLHFATNQMFHFDGNTILYRTAEQAYKKANETV